MNYILQALKFMAITLVLFFWAMIIFVLCYHLYNFILKLVMKIGEVL